MTMTAISRESGHSSAQGDAAKTLTASGQRFTASANILHNDYYAGLGLTS